MRRPGDGVGALSAWLPVRPGPLAAALALAALYWAAAVAGLRFAAVPGAGTPFWPAAGVALAFLVLGGARLWPGIVLGRLMAAFTVQSSLPLWADLVVAFGTALGAVVPVLLLGPLRLEPRLDQLKGMLWLVLGGGVAGATISMGSGALALGASGVSGPTYVAALQNWWFGFLTGVLILAPPILAWARRRAAMRLSDGIHLAATVLASTALAYLVFLRPDLDPSRAWATFPALVWAALAFGAPGAALALVATGGTAVAAAVMGVGPFALTESASARVLLTQEFIAVMAATVLILAAVGDERRNQEQLRRSERRLRAETEALEILNATGAAIAAELDLDKAVQVVTDAGVSLSGARFGAFFYNVPAESGGSYMLYALSGAPRSAFEKFGHPRATAVFAPTFKGEGVVRVHDITQDPRYGREAPHFGMPAGHLPVRAYLAMPVRSRSGEVIGGLFFGHPEPGVFTERAERLIAGLAAQAAIAIDNARLFQAAQRELAERARAEQRQQLLINELNHRVKNTLATVQSIGAQTLRASRDVTEARDAYEARLMALSAAHNLLTARRWESAELREMIEGAVSPFETEPTSRFRLAGPQVELEPASALALAMALHELGTNAVKYGALREPDGRVEVGWRLSDGVLELIWRETGGPQVAPPERQGFGSRLLERSLARELGGAVRLSFPPEGVRCEIRFPLPDAGSGPLGAQA
ncbi:MAG: HWE histidine kinase domain-containing protein [Phenylobacterium sp.]|uniref:HWE histidine kinase domain-containing protein n=1 Tax=Phenylobacterium sp. TaxID=1871053 RepID=UPI00391DB1A4